MESNFIDFIIEHLKNESIFDLMFDSRCESIHKNVAKTKEYEKFKNEINLLDKKIKEKFSDSNDIINLIEERDDVKAYGEQLIEKAMYTSGVYDGLSLNV